MEDQAVHVVGEIGERQFGLGARQPDRADEEAEAVLETDDILVTCSIAGHFPTYWEPVYAGSKWAITCFVQELDARQMSRMAYASARSRPARWSRRCSPTGPRRNCARPRESGSLIYPSEVADAVKYVLTRKRTVTIRDMIVLPTNFDRV